MSETTTTAESSAAGETSGAKVAFAQALEAMQTTSTPVSVRSLIEVGAHFGHQTERWNPKMMKYIFGEKNGVHIINLDKTIEAWTRASKFIFETVARGGNILFVGTKVQAREPVKEEAARCGGHHVTSRWLGGTLTNFQTIRNSLNRMSKLEELLAAAENPNSDVKLRKKERLTISRQLEKLEANLGGIRSMKSAPDVMFVIDLNKEDIAIREAQRLNIPVVALTDTNVDPGTIAFPIPANDDSSRTLRLFLSAIADVVIHARKVHQSRSGRGDESQGGRSRSGRGGAGSAGQSNEQSKDSSVASQTQA
jgi:small subunit ribosomal protein S2